MASVQEEATAAVSAAISASADGDMLSALRSAQGKWQTELAETKDNARSLLANVLAERESLRSSLGMAAALWKTLRPRDMTEPLDENNMKPDLVPKESIFLASDQQIEAVSALQNVSHTLFLAEYMTKAPDALQRAHSSLLKIKEDGLETVVPGNAALLVDAHGILTAGERLRDLIILEVPKADYDTSSLSAWFAKAAETRALLDSIIVDGIFGNLVHLSQKNPRLLVAAARVIESEEVEDQWWTLNHHRFEEKCSGLTARFSFLKEYKKRALDAVVQSLRGQFNEKQRELGFSTDTSGSSNDLQQDGIFLSNVDASSILEWIEQRRSENETVRRFVAPCVPPSFSVSTLYERELHRQFMRIITKALHLVDRDGSMLISEQDLINLTSWYIEYKQEIDDQDEAIDSFLTDSDRNRLVVALQKHCNARISARITSLIRGDHFFGINALGLKKHHDHARKSENLIGIRKALRRDDLPDTVFECIGEQVRRMLALKIQGLDQAVAHTTADCLKIFQSEAMQAIGEVPGGGQEEHYRNFICTTANNMARCLEYSEDLRDLFIPLATDEDRSDIENRMESVIEGFRATAARALQVLINDMNTSLGAHANRLFAPHTGTEIMLDIIATLEDFFGPYEAQLLPYHFEHLAIETLRRVVVWYLAPFLRLSSNKLEESAARRFVSLPIFDGGLHLQGDIQSDGSERDLRTRGTDMRKRRGSKFAGLNSLNGNAVVAQIDKDIANLKKFIETKVVLYQKKQLQPTFEPLQAIRSLYTCPPTTFGLLEAYREAINTIAWAMRPSWVLEMEVTGRLSLRVAEVIWGCRKDVNPVVQLEAINMIRMNAEKLESASQSRMSSFDDGRVWGSKNSEVGGPFSERAFGRERTGTTEHAGSSSSLLWAPSSTSKLKRRPKRR